jgi:hypothetical protein
MFLQEQDRILRQKQLRLAKEFPNLFLIKEAAPNILQYFDI